MSLPALTLPDDLCKSVPMEENPLGRYPELISYLIRFANDFQVPVDEIKAMMELVSELRYRDGYLDGMKYIMKQLLPPRE